MKTSIKSALLASFVALAGSLAYGQVNFPPCNSQANPPVTTNCTDYFGVANYANSPLPIGPVDVTASGFTILDGGEGYSAATTSVTITDFYGTPGAGGATASITIDPNSGAITSITGISGGSGYVAPVVNIVDSSGNGTGATILAKLSTTGVTGGIRKFVPTDLLPSLPIGSADTTTFPGSDYYEIALVDYTQQMHADLPPTHLRGYVQVPTGTTSCPVNPTAQYLGPVILAKKGVPVRVKFMNCLPTGPAGNLIIPTDTTYMGAGNGPDNTPYGQNRATLHLHGGNTPWISDGTPHQWTAPAGDPTNYKKGVSTQNVPDMFFVAGQVVPQCSPTVTNNCSGGTPAQLPFGATNNPGDGNMSFYWTNQQSGRLMFYHDHSYGITRLNVYAGEAAGYLVYDPDEEASLLAAGVPGTLATNGAQTSPDLAHLVPMVIQDKTFTPSAAQLAGEDPTWVWGSGAAAPGFNGNGDLWYPHVYLPNQNPGDPGGVNAFGRWDYGPWFFPPQTSLLAAADGPLGPNSAVTVPCTSAAFPGTLLAPTAANNYLEGCPITPNPSGTPEAFMDTPLVNGKAYPVFHVAPAAYRFRILNAANDRTLNLSIFKACGNGSFSAGAFCPANNTEVPMVQANPGSGFPSTWPTDGRDGGVPDPLAAGPSWVQIGTEGGLLPKAVTIRPNPVNYEYNRRSITVLNVSNHSLLIGPAERADVVVDFSQYAGKTLILYNDAPAPVPAFDSRTDYYTGDPDQVAMGGAPTTLPGYGPNTRTIMQIIVDGNAPNPVPFTQAGVQAGLPATFAASNNTGARQVIVPEPTYPIASGGNATTATYGRISDNSMTYTPVGAAAPITVNYDQKAIQELFTLDYGRMNATMGTELPLTNFLIQTTLPYGYAEWATEIIQDNTNNPNPQPQIWKLTHNGVDTHFIHFHLFNVQVINRIGWDGVVKPPDANELGWKDTVRMNPLEDIVVALQPYSMQLPFPLPDSIRSLDPTMPDGVSDPIISGIDPNTGNRIPGGSGSINERVNFGWEYVWHCHILGHEENDMMRPIIFQVAPVTPSNFSAGRDVDGVVHLSWTDNSANESGFNLQRDIDPAFPNPVNVLTDSNGSSPASLYGETINFADTEAPAGGLYYRLQAEDDYFPQSPLTAPFQPLPVDSGWVTTLVKVLPSVSILAPTITYPQNGVITVSVSSVTGPVPGTVTLTVDGGAPMSQTLAAGSAIYTLSAPSGGSHTLAASYLPQGVYSAASATGSLFVNQAPLTVTAVAASRGYGAANPTLTANITGFVNGDTTASLTGTLACTTTATTASPMGTYPITCSGLSSANYSITYVQSVLTVTAAPLSITANSVARNFGSANPALTATYSGFVNGDTAAILTGTLSCTTSATTASAAGPYPINCSGQSSTRYSITFVAGTLTVNPAPLRITANNATRPYATADPVFSATYSGFVNGNSAASLTGTLVCGTTATFSSAQGTYPITCSGQSSNNYAITYVAGVFSITPPAPILSVSATSAAFTSFVNIASAAQVFTVTNSGSAVMKLTSVNIGGANPARFALVNSCPMSPATIAIGGTCQVSVTYTPIDYTNNGASLSVYPFAPATTKSITLSGSTLHPTVTITPSTLAFGNQTANTTSAARQVTVSNTSPTPLIISSIALTGASPTSFAQSGNCPINGAGLAANSSCTINVTFTPSSKGARAANLVFTDLGVGSPQTVTLSGTGQ